MSRNILLINSLGIGGAERVFSSLVNYFSEFNDDFSIVSIINNVGYHIEPKIKVETLTDRSSLKLFQLPFFLIKFFFICIKAKPDKVQSHLFWSNYINAICSLFLRYDAQLVHCVSFESKFPRGLSRYLHFAFSFVLLKKCSLNIFKSIEMRDEYIQLFNIPKKNTVVIYNPITLDILENKDFDTSKHVNVAVVGRFHHSKRYKDLIEVAHFFKAKCIFQCVGKGELFNAYKASIEKANIANSFILHGWVNNPISIIDTADIYLSCSESEGFPNALIEAMSRGLPAVHSECKTGPREILGEVIEESDGYKVREYGITFSVGDSKAITSIIEAFINGELKFKKFSDLSIFRAKELSKIDSLNAYRELLNGVVK